MYERIEELLQLKKMCLNEIQQAQANCELYSSNVAALTGKLNESWDDTTKFLIEYDSFITNITSIMDITRKFNLQLLIHNTKLCEMQGVFTKKGKTVSQSTTLYADIEKTISNYSPAEEFDLSSEGYEDFDYPIFNICEFYKENDIINGTITHVKNFNDLSFFMFDNSSKYRPALVELAKSVDLRQYHEMPKAFEVFGLVLDNQIFRAVLGSKTYYDDEMNEKIIPCYILDTGEILALKSEHIMYKLTTDQKNIPALALPCQVQLKNPFVAKETIQNKLKELEYNSCKFKVVSVDNNMLRVEIIETDVHSEAEAINNTTLPVDSNRTVGIQLTEEELSMLYEEPLNTSNAMKAVMGYDPQDDKRICRFYNSLTGGCFKGAKCKLEHTLRQSDGWTKDMLPTTSVLDNHPITVFKSGSIINITPTYVGQLDRFFAQINDPHKSTAPLLWNDEDVPSRKHLQKPPHMFEIVLSRYVDGLWYRAKIMSHDDDYKMFEVFYVDYGNIQVVHLRNLASIEASIAQLPFQAVLCRLEAVTVKSLSPDEHKNSIEILCEMILNKTMDVQVISHYEDLFVTFVDKKNYPLPDILVEMGYLEFNKNKVHL